VACNEDMHARTAAMIRLPCPAQSQARSQQAPVLDLLLDLISDEMGVSGESPDPEEPVL
jgi:hypothetical protein